MTTLAALVAATPAATRGVPTGFVYGTGVWRHVLELADPAAGSSVAWHDITAFFAGYEYTRGSDGYQGRYRASVATIDLWTDDDSLAPWNPDTSATFGTHIDLGPGLLIRSGFIRVVGSAVDAWNPRFTNKVEVWGDASYSHGKARQHRIIARDTLTSAVGIPLPATFEENWSDRMYHWLTDSGWPYGSAIYGAQFEVDTTTPILTLPDRPAASSAINELDAILDPVGLVWYTNRLGQLVVRPTVYDTFHADAFAAGATGDQWPTDVDPIGFSWAACSGTDFSDNASYAIDHSPSAPFGLDRTELALINHVVVTSPAGTFDDDDPISIQRYDRHSFQASWIAENDIVAAALLDFRKDATVEARPLYTTIDLPGFHPGPARADYLDYITIDHRNTDAGLSAFANGYLRSYREQVAPRGCDTAWALTFTIDVYNVTSDAGLLPVEDLTLVGISDWEAEFSWTNPTQLITPTHTQVRLLNPASLWLTTDYPISGLFWGGLAPTTTYEFQVRLIRVVDGLVTHYSPSRTLEFTTGEATVPHVDDGDVELPPPDPGCIVGWTLSWSVDGDAPWTVIDSGTVEEPPFEFHIDTTVLNDDYWYRVCSNEICGGVDGPVTCSALFPIGCRPTARLLDAPYDDVDLVAYWPEVCEDHIAEAVSDQPMTFGPALTGVGFDAFGIPVMQSGPQGVIGYGAQPAAPDGFDLTIAVRARIHTQPSSEITLFNYAGLWISVVADGAGYRVHAHAQEAESGVVTTNGLTTLALDTVYTISLTHDVTGTGTGDLRLWIGGTQDAHASGVGARVNTGFYLIGLPADSWITDVAVWDAVIALVPTAAGTWGGWTATVTGAAAAPFNPVTSIAWAHLYYAGGPVFQALSLSNGASMASTNWPDEIAANASPLNGGSGTYRSADSQINSKPSVQMPGSGSGKKHTTSLAGAAQVATPFSIVFIFNLDSASGSQYIFDGANDGSSGQRVLFRALSGVWEFYMGTSRTGGTVTTGLKAARFLFTSGNDTMTINGSTIISGVDCGSGAASWLGVTLSESGVVMSGRVAFFGVIAGDITAAGNWSAFQAWVLSEYGVNIS